MDEQNKNLILATALSFIVILVWFVLFPPPEPETPIDGTIQTTEGAVDGAVVPIAPADTTAPAAAIGTSPQAPTEALANAPRVPIATDRLRGSISLLGGRIDDLKLNDYRTTLDADAEVVTMLSPEGTDGLPSCPIMLSPQQKTWPE